MYKHLLITILALVMVFSITSCSNTQVTENTVTAVSNNTEKVIIPLMNLASINTMSPDELSYLINTMHSLSEVEKLSATDMMNMGYNISNIISLVPDIYEETLDSKIISLFDNVYSQCVNQQIPLENISSWTRIPIVQILLLYFSGNFTNVEDVDCIALYYLSEDEAIKVADTIFNNPVLFENSVNMVFEAITSPYEYIQDLGIAVLTHVSKHYSPVSPSVVSNYCTVLSINSIATSALSLEKVESTRQIIIANKNLDFVTKYSIFCNSTDTEVSDWAKAELLKVAKDCDKETASYIKDLSKVLDDKDFSSKLLKQLKK